MINTTNVEEARNALVRDGWAENEVDDIIKTCRDNGWTEDEIVSELIDLFYK